MFFLSTIDHTGRPTVSYKGGMAGFVRVLDANTLIFPSYDGNGMYLSMGNISGNPEIGMLFMDFEKPFRLRAQGKAELIVSGPEVEAFKDAEMAVKVAIHEVWMNCPRYIHRFQETRNVALCSGRRRQHAVLRVEAHRCHAGRRAAGGARKSRSNSARQRSRTGWARW